MNIDLKHVEIFTDGACLGNPGPGGWCAILRFKDHEKEITGGSLDTTNNRMELTAVIKGLEALNHPCKVTLTSDSKYVIDAVEKGWAKSWQARGWKRGNNKPALNPDLWQQLMDLLEVHDVSFVWVRGHQGHPENERCDSLAFAKASQYQDKL